jgi:hypothetical protein
MRLQQGTFFAWIVHLVFGFYTRVIPLIMNFPTSSFVFLNPAFAIQLLTFSNGGF